jgi:glycosyltransferase involved in cell wall biosynthesis
MSVRTRERWVPVGRSNPQISVVIPTRDRGKLLGLALASALRQREVDLEVIVVDDGSGESTASASVRADVGVRLYRQERKGVSAARNRGISEARGEWIAFLDDDDLWAPDKLTQQLDAAIGAGRSWAYGGEVSIDEDLRVVVGGPPPTPEDVMATLPRYNPLPAGASNVIVRADVLAEVGGFDPLLRRTEDWDMWIRLARVGPPAGVARPLVAYRFHSANVPLETSSLIREPAFLARRYGIPVNRAAMERRAAWICLRAGRRGKALRHYARAVSLGDLRSVPRALVALAHPAAGTDRIFGLLRRRPEDEVWRREAQAWLDELAAVRLEGRTM